MKTCYEYRTNINAILSNNSIRLWIYPQIINIYWSYTPHSAVLLDLECVEEGELWKSTRETVRSHSCAKSLFWFNWKFTAPAKIIEEKKVYFIQYE